MNIKTTMRVDTSIFLHITEEDTVPFDIQKIQDIEEDKNTGGSVVTYYDVGSVFSSKFESVKYAVLDRKDDIKNAIDEARRIRAEVRKFISDNFSE